jgi:hypothetical protein
MSLWNVWWFTDRMTSFEILLDTQNKRYTVTSFEDGAEIVSEEAEDAHSMMEVTHKKTVPLAVFSELLYEHVEPILAEDSENDVYEDLQGEENEGFLLGITFARGLQARLFSLFHRGWELDPTSHSVYKDVRYTKGLLTAVSRYGDKTAMASRGEERAAPKVTAQPPQIIVVRLGKDYRFP